MTFEFLNNFRDNYLAKYFKDFKDWSVHDQDEHSFTLKVGYRVFIINILEEDFDTALAQVKSVLTKAGFNPDSAVRVKPDNVKPSPADIRDYIYTATEPNLPDNYDIRGLMQDVRDQGATNMCVAYSACGIKEFQEQMDYAHTGYFSAQFIYHFRNDHSGDNGMYMRDALDVLKHRGVPLEADYPLGMVDPPAISVMQKAIKNKIESYHRVQTVATAKHAIRTNGGLLVVLPIYLLSSPEKFWLKNGVITGSHAVEFVGWNPEGFILRNSWGKNYGTRGCVTFPFSDWVHVIEAWSIKDSKSS